MAVSAGQTRVELRRKGETVKRSLLTSIIVTMAMSLVVLPALAKKKADTLAKWGTNPEKVAKKVWFGPSASEVKKLGKIGLPKRVGLISFYIFDNGTHEFSALAATYGGTYFKSFGLNARGANKFSSALAKLGLPVLEKQFAAHGMELLTPIEFLETEAQKRAYISYNLPEGGFKKFTKAMLKVLDKNPHASGAADGFEMIPVHLWMDRQTLRSLEELRKELGLDAIAVLANTTATRPVGVALTSVVLQVFGPNPEPLPENKIAAKYYTAMIPYASGTFGKGFKGAGIHYWKKPEQQELFDGYDGIIEGLASRTLEKIAGFAKP